MIPQWNSTALGVLAILVLYLQFRINRIRENSRRREELFQIVTENAADMIALVDMKGRRLYNSPAYKRVLGYSAAELGETSSFEQIHPDDRFKVLEAAREARSSGIGRKLDYRIRHKDGTWRILESVASAIRNEKGVVNKLVIVNRDVTERKRAEEQLEHNSFHDALTGLPNRRLFLDRLQHIFARAQRNPESHCAVLFVDLDGFKRINDSLTPTLGDQVIIEMGNRLAACLRGLELRPSSRDWAETNSPSCWKRSATPAMLCGRPSEFWSQCQSLCWSKAESCKPPPAWASLWARPHTNAPGIFCKMPTWPCAAPKPWAGTAAKYLMRPCIRAPSIG
jgi:PAS domain S-box-containing protein